MNLHNNRVTTKPCMWRVVITGLAAYGMVDDPLVKVIACVLAPQRGTDDPIKQLHDIRLKSMARMLHWRIAQMHSHGQRQACYRMLEEISETQTHRLLSSPALCEVLRSGVPENRIVALLASVCASGTGRRLNAWSVMGNVWLGTTPPLRFPFLCRHDARFCGPRLACCIPVDLSLPEQAIVPSAGLRQASALSNSDLAATVTQIDNAVGLLAEIYPLGHQVFTRLVGNVVIRHDAARPLECWGASSGIAIGRVVIVNALAQPDTRMLGEVLLHESTHCAMDCAELYRPLWQSDDSDSRAMGTPLAYPWTGNELTVHAFAHACIVWAVLLRYWTVCEQRNGADEVSQTRRFFIERGFTNLKQRTDVVHALASLNSVAMGAVTVAAQSAAH